MVVLYRPCVCRPLRVISSSNVSTRTKQNLGCFCLPGHCGANSRAGKAGFRDVKFRYLNNEAFSAASPDTIASQPISILLEFEGSFPNLISFLNDVAGLTTVVSIERVTVKRDEAILPRQVVSMVLTTYLY